MNNKNQRFLIPPINIFAPRNRKGDKILSVYWFAILIIVAGGIFGMVYVFYGTPYDVREIEANLLANRVADCISYAGKINSEFISNGIFIENNSLENCHLIFSSTEFDSEQYFTEVSFYKLGDLNNSLLNINKGNNNFISSCAIQEDKEQKRLVKCVKKSFYSVDDFNSQYIIKILSVVGKTEKNVKL